MPGVFKPRPEVCDVVLDHLFQRDSKQTMSPRVRRYERPDHFVEKARNLYGQPLLRHA